MDYMILNNIPAGARARLQAYLRNPTPASWDEIAGMIIQRPNTSLWKAVIAVDPSFPRSAGTAGTPADRWRRIPDAATIERALAHHGG